MISIWICCRSPSETKPRLPGGADAESAAAVAGAHAGGSEAREVRSPVIGSYSKYQRNHRKSIEKKTIGKL